MDAGRDRTELTRSYEGPSWSEFDRGFCTDRSLSLSDGMIKSVVLEYSEPSIAVTPSLNYSTGLLSPFVAVKKMALSPGNTLSTVLNSPVEGKSSTPYGRALIQKPILANSLDLSCVDLTTSHPSWEVSLVKAVVESPKFSLESTWSPIIPSAPPEASLVWSGASPNPGEELQRSWKEMIDQGSSQAAATPDLRESSSNLAI